jgi:hypothetical protein
VAVRCEELNITGSLFRNRLKYQAYLNKRVNTNPVRGPFHHRAPSRMFYKAIRGMLPHKSARGAAALSHLRVFEGVPPPFDKARLRPPLHSRNCLLTFVLAQEGCRPRGSACHSPYPRPFVRPPWRPGVVRWLEARRCRRQARGQAQEDWRFLSRSQARSQQAAHQGCRGGQLQPEARRRQPHPQGLWLLKDNVVLLRIPFWVYCLVSVSLSFVPAS